MSNSNIEQFGNLVQDAQRDDDYINATEWCKRFRYDLRNWKRFPETKARFEHLKTTQSNVEPWIVERVGKTWVTWVHPIMAIHLASYLDPAFANYVAEIFIRYAKADPILAADIASRQNTVEGLDIINEAVQKRYSFIRGCDFICEIEGISFDGIRELEEGKALCESNIVSILNKKFRLPSKEKTVVTVPSTEDTVQLLEDFLKDKYPNIYQSAYKVVDTPPWLPYTFISLEDEVALLSYFTREIHDWVKEKGGTATF